MLIENTVALGLILLISYFYRKKRRVAISIAILPIAIIPFSQILSLIISSFLNIDIIYIIITLLSLGITAFLIGLFAKNINKKSARNTYIAVCGLYALISTFAFIYKFFYLK